MSKKINLKGHTLIVEYESKRKKLQGSYTADRLAKTFVDEWTKTWECELCGRLDYCKYAVRIPHYRIDRGWINHCGVAKDVMTNYVKNTFHLLPALRPDQLQDYLDGAYYFAQFILDAEMGIAMCLSTPTPINWAAHEPVRFGRLSRLRGPLNSRCSSLKSIPAFKIQEKVLFVEGESEQAFLKEMRGTQFSFFFGLNIFNYKGRGNVKSKRIEMLLKKFISDGYKIYIQGDADGKEMGRFNSLISKGLVEKECIFAFERDFENAIPINLLWAALKEIVVIKGVQLKSFIKKMGSGGDFIRTLKKEYSLDVESVKVKLAVAVANVIKKKGLQNLLNDVDFLDSELGQFTLFLNK